jgi:hypothetical protein
MTTHVAEFFKKKRLSLGLKLSQVARCLGYKNAGRSLCHGCNKLQRFETTGDIDSRLFQKLMAVLEIDQTTVNGLFQKDIADWLKWANEPVKPCLVVRLMAAIYSQNELPDNIRSTEEAERYASEFAKEHRLRVCLVLSRRVSVYFDDDGLFQYASEAVPGGEPNQPFTKIGGRRCLMSPTERGIALREVAWFKRPQPREGE